MVTVATDSSSWDQEDLLLQDEGHWEDQWDLGDGVVINLPFDENPDPRTEFRGSSSTGKIEIGNSVMRMLGNPRYYIDNSDIGWRNVEFTGYATWISDGEKLSSVSGFTMAARSSHDLYADDGCEAFGYYARIYRDTGECAFQKEYYHDKDNDTIYGRSIRTPCLELDTFTDSIQVGMKFTVTTLDDTATPHPPGSVELRLFLDLVGDNQSWQLVHRHVDEPGSWLPTGDREVPQNCPHKAGATVRDAGNVCFIRADGSMDTIVQWRQASIANRFAYCGLQGDECNDHLDCCSESCDPFGYCTDGAVVPFVAGRWRSDYSLRASTRQAGRTKQSWEQQYNNNDAI